MICMPELVRKMLAEGKVGVYETLSAGISMFPTIWPHSILRAVKFPLEEIGKGDIIIFQRDNKMVAHRVVEVGQGFVRTQGDSCRVKDEVVDSTNYLCKVVEYVLFKKFTINEKSLYWKVQRWLFANFFMMHVLNFHFTKVVVKVALFMGIRYPKE